MEIKVDDTKIIMDNGTWLCLKTQEINTIQTFIDNKKPIQYNAKITEHREKRSLDANAYAWVLISKLADKLRTSKEEVYFQMLKDYGQSQIVSVISQGKELFQRTCKYWEEAGESTLNGKDFTHFKVYTGSSEYNTKEMAVLIDGIVYECKELEIETMTPEQLTLLKEEWKQ